MTDFPDVWGNFSFGVLSIVVFERCSVKYVSSRLKSVVLDSASGCNLLSKLLLISWCSNWYVLVQVREMEN